MESNVHTNNRHMETQMITFENECQYLQIYPILSWSADNVAREEEEERIDAESLFC